MTSRTPAVLLATALLLTAGNVAAVAGDGDAVAAGQVTKVDGTTTLVNTAKGPALSLESGRKWPSLAVSSNRVVPRLNADLVDGLDSGQLGTRTLVYRLPAKVGTSAIFTFPNLPEGQYLVNYSVYADIQNQNAVLACRFVRASDSQFSLVGVGANFGGVITAASSSGWLSAGPNTHELACSTSYQAPFSIPGPSSFVSQVTFTSLLSTDLRDASRSTPRPRGHGGFGS